MPMVDLGSVQLWKYWVITIPLTAVVMAIWTAYISVADGRDRRRIQVAKEELRKELVGSVASFV